MVKWKSKKKRIKIGEKIVNTSRFSYGITVLEESEQDLDELLQEIDRIL